MLSIPTQQVHYGVLTLLRRSLKLNDPEECFTLISSVAALLTHSCRSSNIDRHRGAPGRWQPARPNESIHYSSRHTAQFHWAAVGHCSKARSTDCGHSQHWIGREQLSYQSSCYCRSH